MQCEEFEDRLLDYDALSAAQRIAVDAHASVCAGCREFLEAAAQVDESLAALYSGIEPRRRLALTALLTKPSALPEVLDFLGWAAVVAAIVILGVVLANQYGIRLALPS